MSFSGSEDELDMAETTASFLLGSSSAAAPPRF